MNYIKTVLFIIFFGIDNYIIGTAFLKFFKIKEKTFEKKIVCGFLALFLFGFFVGLPSQLFSISWNSFFVIFTIVNIILLSACIKYSKDELVDVCSNIKQNPRRVLVNHFKNRWFIYLLVILFSLLSILNTQPYLWCNYHDDYYITKVVNLQGTPHLLNEDYGTGALIQYKSLFSFFKAQGYRGFNTYELIYAYFGSVFFIDLLFFCRFSLCIYIYLITFFVYKIIAETLIGNNEKTQFSLLFFCLLMIPAGFASSRKIAIRMFENWRFQTAIYYGGSIIRNLAFPLYMLAFKRIYEKVSLKNIILMFLMFLALISFQTSALTYLFFLIPIFLFLILFKVINKQSSKKKRIDISIILIAMFIIVIVIADRVFSSVITNHLKYSDLMKYYLPYYNDIFICDIFALTAFIPIVSKLIYDVKKNRNIVSDLILFFSYLIFRLNTANYFLSIISVYKFYSLLRVLTSVLLLVVLYWGIFLQELFFTLMKKKSGVMLSLICFFLAVCTVIYVKTNEKNIIKYTEPAQSATPQGYSLKIVTSNDKMLPDLIANVGNYFNSLPYGNYKLISEGYIPYKNTYIDNESFLLASNRIELVYPSTSSEMDPNYGTIQKYLRGEVPYSTAKAMLNASGANYIVTTRKNIAKDLQSHNYAVVYHDKANHSWTLKRK